MAGNKIDELNLASMSLTQILAAPENKDGFLVSVVDFDNGSETVCFAESAVGLHIPSAVSQGGTNFDSALKRVIKVVSDFKAQPNPDGWHYLRTQVLFLSDGQSSVSQKNIRALQEVADVTSIAYGSDADESTLASIASDGIVHVVGTQGGELRKFLADVGKTLSQGLANAK